MQYNYYFNPKYCRYVKCILPYLVIHSDFKIDIGPICNIFIIKNSILIKFRIK